MTGSRKEAIVSVGCDLLTADDLWVDPVISSSAAVCLSRLLIFRSANTMNTRITATAKLSRVRQRRVSQGTAKRSRMLEHQARERVPYILPLRGMRILQCYRLTDYWRLGTSEDSCRKWT